MKRTLFSCAATLLLAAVPLEGQSGFALKGGAVFNSSRVDERQTQLRPSDAAGFHVGAELVLPLGLGVGISGYTAGSPRDFDLGEGSLVMLAEANYFFRLPAIPLSPYVGAHTGLGTYDLGDVRDRVRPKVDFGDLGFQVGVRFQPTALIGLDAQYRRVSGSVEGQQDASLETNQFLIGLTLF